MDPSLQKKKPKGDRHHRRRLVLVDPAAVAFEGWRSVATVWTLKTCKSFVGWCHIDKLFPYHRHRRHLDHNYANLHYCRDDKFVQRCIEVYRFLYNTPKVVQSEVGLNICQMVYAEVKLNRTVDWRTMKASKKITIPRTKDIPTAGPSKNPRDGLGPRKNIKDTVADVDYQWSDSSKSNSSDDEIGPERLDNVEYPTMEQNLPPVVPEERTMGAVQTIQLEPAVGENVSRILHEEGTLGGVEMMNVEAAVEVEQVQCTQPTVYEVPQYRQTQMNEIEEDELEGEIVFEGSIDPLLPRELQVGLPRNRGRQTKKFYEAKLKKLENDLDKK